MNKLLEIREAKHLTQRKLAKDSNVPQQTISAIESGERKNPGILTIRRLANALGCLIDDIYPAETRDKDTTSEKHETKQ